MGVILAEQQYGRPLLSAETWKCPVCRQSFFPNTYFVTFLNASGNKRFSCVPCHDKREGVEIDSEPEQSVSEDETELELEFEDASEHES